MQFTLRTMLLSTAVVAIALAGYAVALGGLSWEALSYPLYMLTYLWFFVPAIFMAYAAGRRQLTVWMVVTYAACQAGAVGLVPLLGWLDSLVAIFGAPPAANP
jgi:hypothetical protein